jgi:hypothetical protein
MANPASYSDATGETDSQVRRGSSNGYPGTPRWVKVSGIVALILIVLVVVVMMLGGGEHGPMRHIPSAGGETSTPPTATGI